MWNDLKKIYLFIARLIPAFYLCLFCLFGPPVAQAASVGQYDIVYFRDKSLDSVLDYREELESILGRKVAGALKVVGIGNRYGVVYDRNGTALSSAGVAVRHNGILAKVGMQAEAEAIDSREYFDLYNVSYGMGADRKRLERQYGIIYHYLGQDVGKALFIEKTAHNHYVLVYRRLGKKESSLRVAKRHAALLEKKGIGTSIALEYNNEIVFGESSYLRQGDKSSCPTKARGLKKRPMLYRKPQKSNSAIKPAVRVGEGATSLEKRLEGYIKRLRQKRKIASDERTAWLVYDFTIGRNLIDINVDKSLQAASMIKPFVALAFFHKVKEGRLIYGPKSRRKMEAMIQHSDNKATNWVMRYVGGPKAVERTLKKYYGDIFQFTKVVEYIPANGRTYRNQAAPRDYGKFLEALWSQKLTFGKEIRRLMALPNRDRLYHGTTIPRGTLVYDKTGTTAHLCGDMGILSPKGQDGRRYPYVFVGVIEKQKRTRDYGRWMLARGNIIRKVSNLVYNTLKEEHGLL